MTKHFMDSERLEDIINLIIEFTEYEENILALALCGSYARGTPGPDSDIDFSILTTDHQQFKSDEWIETFPFSEISETLAYWKDVTYGPTWSRHVYLKSGIEIEFGFANKDWANLDPIDEGTRKVVCDGFRILYDPHEIYSRLKASG